MSSKTAEAHTAVTLVETLAQKPREAFKVFLNLNSSIHSLHHLFNFFVVRFY